MDTAYKTISTRLAEPPAYFNGTERMYFTVGEAHVLLAGSKPARLLDNMNWRGLLMRLKKELAPRA